EELSQYPASWLPDVKEGEPIVCIGVTTAANGQQMPILMGAEAAQQRFGREVVAPEIMEKYQSLIEVPEETMLETPEELEQMVEAPLMEEAPVVKEELPEVEIKPVVEEASQSQGQEKDDGAKVETTGAEQAPQRLFHDVKAAPVKVGEVYDAKQAEEPDVAQQIDTGLAQALEKGESMVRIQLNPENLGSVTVEITRSAEGILHVALNAHSGETRGLLERHAGELQGMLASRTEQNVEVEVQRQQESQQGQNQQQNYDGRNGHAQDGQERRRQRHDQTSSQDFMQQLRLGLIPLDGE
ncbi:MAG: flagellar hook-length control protein FliK, partial [Oscillospiraceae bacterium]|nr:flagellar hook-length control protein FliK [Oscillospiraceae bacterium]